MPAATSWSRHFGRPPARVAPLAPRRTGPVGSRRSCSRSSGGPASTPAPLVLAFVVERISDAAALGLAACFAVAALASFLVLRAPAVALCPSYDYYDYD